MATSILVWQELSYFEIKKRIQVEEGLSGCMIVD